MSQRSEIYRELREQIKTLGELAGQQSTNDLVAGLDPFWRMLLRVRSAMVKTLKIQNKITDNKDVSADDFASLFLQIHNPKREARLCEHCCGLVEFGISTCPYCGEHVNGQNTQQFINSISIDIQARPKGPNWNIDYSSKEMLDKAKLKEEFDQTPRAIPRVTRFEELGGPKGLSGERVRTYKKKLSRTAQEILWWARQRELAQGFPYSIPKLQQFKRGDLAILAGFFKEKSGLPWEKLWTQPMAELIKFISNNQPQAPFDVGPPPVGEIPEIEFQEEAGNGGN